MTAWQDRSRADRRFFTYWAAALGVVLVAVAGLGWLDHQKRLAAPTTQTAASDAAVAAVTALMTFEPDASPEQRAEVAGHLTGVLAADYELRGADVVFPTARRSGVAMSVDVTDAATVIEENRTARVLIFADQRIVVGAQKDPPSPIGVSRWALMVKVEDQWRLAGLEPVSPQ